MGGLHLLHPHRRQHEEGCLRTEVEEEAQPLQRVLVAPLQVVQHQQAGTAHEGARQGHPGLLAAGELPDARVDPVAG